MSLNEKTVSLSSGLEVILFYPWEIAKPRLSDGGSVRGTTLADEMLLAEDRNTLIIKADKLDEEYRKRGIVPDPGAVIQAYAENASSLRHHDVAVQWRVRDRRFKLSLRDGWHWTRSFDPRGLRVHFLEFRTELPDGDVDMDSYERVLWDLTGLMGWDEWKGPKRSYYETKRLTWFGGVKF